MSRESTRKRRRSNQPPPDENFLAPIGINHTQQRILLIVGVVVAVLASSVGFTAAVASLGRDVTADQTGAALGLGKPRPEVYRAWTSPKLFAPIADRQADAEPLTAKEIFGAKTVKNGKITLRLLDSQLDADCAAAVWGQGLIGELSKAGCTQAVRGVFLSSDRRYVAHYTMFNLGTAQAADSLVNALNVQYRGNWTQALPNPRAVFPVDGYSEGSGHAMGHYAGLVWLARVNGGEPARNDDFVALSLAVRSVEKALYRRVVAASGAGAAEEQ
ncbi:hypothetical protein Misp01_73640 [Microtetraspora sp. NBRC 13810]|uniref:hypothetical protein n=1 Tax=Microtetraspora sp. NBRC 13810 TaxID=3030990 RepID=UPI0024A4511B|nr:hypothetical protein [Microtetraspora sp. NBRC 13810]GLW12236.1 hypothetical protein Misp01_73640 [Microtetraspora sp. NBRC 13810]